MKFRLSTLAAALVAAQLTSLAHAATQPTDSDLGEIVNLGSQAWSFIEKNQPVATEQFATANGLPTATPNWEGLEDWQEGESEIQTATFRNAYKEEVVRFTYRLHYFFGGSAGHHGRFLADVKVVPEDVHVAWGYHLDATASVSGVMNTGSQEDPVAGLEITVGWTVHTTLSHVQQSQSFFLRGDGELRAS